MTGAGAEKVGHRRHALQGDRHPVGTVGHLRRQAQKHQQRQGQHRAPGRQHIDKTCHDTRKQQGHSLDWRHLSSSVRIIYLVTLPTRSDVP